MKLFHSIKHRMIAAYSVLIVSIFLCVVWGIHIYFRDETGAEIGSLRSVHFEMLFFAVACTVVLAALGLNWYFSYRTTKGLRRLVRQISDISGKPLQDRLIHVDSNDESRLVADSLNNLMARRRRAEEALLESEKNFALLRTLQRTRLFL